LQITVDVKQRVTALHRAVCMLYLDQPVAFITSDYKNVMHNPAI